MCSLKEFLSTEHIATSHHENYIVLIGVQTIGGFIKVSRGLKVLENVQLLNLEKGLSLSVVSLEPILYHISFEYSQISDDFIRR